jgi:hypothetical protein
MSALAPSGQIDPDVTAMEYHARKLGVVSKSALDQIERSPAHYLAWVQGKLQDEHTPAMVFGSAFHCALLEPEVFEARYTWQPDFGDCRFKEAKVARDQWRSRNSNKIALSLDDWERIDGMVASVRNHPLAGRMIRSGVPELTVRWMDRETGLQCKCRADYYVESRAMVLDVKTTEDARPEAFRKSVARYNYHVQDALYRAGFEAAGKPVRFFVLVCVEKTYPYAVATYQLSAKAIELGHDVARRGIAKMAACLESGDWAAYPVGIQDLELPPWAG